MVKKTSPMVKKADPDTPDCGCAFIIDADGVPTVECPTNEAQAMAFAALQRNPDVSITVAAAIVPAVVEEADEDQIEELGPEDDSEFDDNADLEEEEEDDPLPF